jgi:hypothetical protein
MTSWHKGIVFGAALLTAAASADAHMGGMGGRSSSGFHGFHGTHGFHSRFPFHYYGPNFAVTFPGERFGTARNEGWSGGAYSGDVAGFDYDDDSDFAAEDLHFRVQDSFGPGDIGRPPPPPEPYDYGPWGAARMDPWHGYEPDDE